MELSDDIVEPAQEPVGECPECKKPLPKETVRPSRFNCPACGKELRPVRRRSYLWLRGLSCGVVAVLLAKFRTGLPWSFLFFVVVFYAVPVLFLWEVIAFAMFPPTKFEPVPSPFQSLGIDNN